MAQETELKLSLAAQDLPRLLAHPLLRGAPRRQHLLNTYFDTPALQLRQQRMAVRERVVGRQTLLTVKTAGQSVGGLSRRGEWEAPTRPGAFDFAGLVDEPALAASLSRMAWQLVPVFRTDFHRRTWWLDHAGARIEVALDEGRITSGAALAQPILELELELLDGPVDALLDLAHTLALGPEGDACHALRLRPAQRSKAERGYALFLGERPQPVRAAALALQPGMHPVEAFRAAALSCLAHLQANEDGVQLPEPDPEFVHQARVALRRLRTGLRLFQRHLPPRFARHWGAEWKALAGTLGEARNWDVLATETLPARLPDTDRSPSAQALREWVQAQRQVADMRAAAALASPAHALRVLAFTRGVLALPVPDTPSRGSGLARWAAAHLRRRHSRLRQQAREARQAGPQGRHALRLAVKQQRYALEFLASLLPPRRAAQAAATLANAQALLGELNDLSTAQALLAEVPAGLADEAVVEVQERLTEALSLGLRGLPRLERALERTERPWR